MRDRSIHHFVYLLGPTGVGKTEISLKIAEQYRWPIINCDSVQAYCHLDIGSSKPTRKERSEVPHFLFDYVEPPGRLTVAGYIKNVVSCLKKNKLQQALFVGGSGFYVQALEKGLYPRSNTSETVKKQVSEWIEAEGFESLYTRVEKRDPEWIKTVSSRDHYRLRRALEIMESQGNTITQLKEEMAHKNHSLLPTHSSLKLGLKMDKESLRKRIERRTDEMFDRGLIEEVASLVNRGLGDWPPLQSVGYREVQGFLKHGGSHGELRSKIITSTMQLIKKQMTWFKRDKDILWFLPDQKQEIFDRMNVWFEKIDLKRPQSID